MIHMEMPHVNVLSKLDMAEQNDNNFDLEFYTDLFDLERLLDHNNQIVNKKHRKFLERISEVQGPILAQELKKTAPPKYSFPLF